METIEFYDGEETRPVVDGSKRYGSSIFKDQIYKAVNTVEDIIKNGIKKRKETTKFSTKDVYVNNIVAFIGDRGSGKTSCMYSVVKILQEISDDVQEVPKDLKEIKISKKLKILDSVDPSYFDEKHNIIELIISMMYKDLLCKVKASDCFGSEKNNAEETTKLRELFSGVKVSLQYIDGKNKFDDGDELEDLASLSSGVNLKQSIYELVNEYLTFFGKDMLVISIDDVDLNTAQAYEMVEQIRKYLILPNVVILIAFKMEQLSDVIKLKLTKNFKDLLDKNEISMSEIAEMTERYLTKLFPFNNRVYMSLNEGFFNSDLIVYSDEGEKKELYHGIVRDTIPHLIYEKCRYLFYNSAGRTSMIIPRNLRTLRLFLKMLLSMNSCEKSYIDMNQEEKNTVNRNKEQFKHFLFGTWLDDMNSENRNIAKTLINEEDMSVFNKETVQLMRGDIDKAMVTDKDTEDGKILSVIINNGNSNYNVSLADSFFCLDYLSRILYDKESLQLIFFIKALYSIRLYEAYSHIIDSINDNAESPLDKINDLTDINEIQKLVGGSYYLLEGDSILPKTNSGNNRELRLLNGSILNQAIVELVEKQQLSDEETKKLQLVEFFMLTTSHYVRLKNSEEKLVENDYRSSSDINYNRSLISKNLKNIVFDITSVLFNILDVKRCYARFNKDIFNIAQNNQNSLYNTIIKYNQISSSETENEEVKKKKLYQEFLSKICLRNSEVIDNFFIQLKDNKENYDKKDTFIDLVSFFKAMKNMSMNTYNKEENVNSETEDSNKKIGEKDHYKSISLKTISCIGQVLDNIKNDNDCKNLFNSIYEPSLSKELDDFFVKHYYARKAKTALTQAKQEIPEMKDISQEELNAKLPENGTQSSYSREDLRKAFDEILRKHNFLE
ncbi:MAG: hypothetical protein LKF70_01125 [Prevotella sp.]|jgi:hypothetical protein|nr:hypothetical protein [Prevotella sp.]MCH4240446.1 hypothetical protein [Prevotella sp.]